MEKIQVFLMVLWNDWLDNPVYLLKHYTKIDWTEGNALLAYKIVMACLAVIAALWLLYKFLKIFMKLFGFHAVLQAIADRKAASGKHKAATRWYKLAGDIRRMAEELAWAGFPAKAVDIMEHHGFYASAGAVLESTGNYSSAIAMYNKANDIPSSAVVTANSGKFELAVRMFDGYFRKTKDSEGARLEAAKKCWLMLTPRGGCDAVPAKFKDTLLLSLAECFDRAGEWYHAGINYMGSGRFGEALRCFRQIPEDHKRFEPSRVLLAQCFCELHDYGNCQAILASRLEGKSVDSSTLGLFYVMGIAKEGLGHLQESREIFQRILEVDPAYPGVSERRSHISSRIDMGGDKPLPVQHISSMDTQIRSMVERGFGDRYPIDGELGSGGMGRVFRGRDKLLGRPVALKYLGSDLVGNPKHYQRFLHEAQIAASLNHENIVQIYDTVPKPGEIYLVLELVEGPDLFHYIQDRGALPLREAVNIIMQACTALKAIHEKGIIHRDIKPENFLIGPGEKVKLTDLGLAMDPRIRMTCAGAVMGTFCYMSPEQANGRDVGPATDIYAIGLVLYEALVGYDVLDGQRAYSCRTLDERLKEEKPNPPSEVGGEHLKPFDGIIIRCLEDNPEDRYTAEELLRALEGVSKL